MAKERFKLIPEVYLMPIKGTQILLSQRINTGYEDGNFSFVAGHAEDNESMLAAMVREAKEEAGVDIDRKDLELRVVLHRKTDRQQVGFYFIVKKWRGEFINQELEKCGELRWVEIDNLPKNVIPYIRQAIENTTSKKYYSELNW